MKEVILSTYAKMVQGDDPLEVKSNFELDDDVNISYDKLTLLCHKLLKKYDLLKKNDFILKENETLLNENDVLKKENVSLPLKLNVSFEENNSL